MRPSDTSKQQGVAWSWIAVGLLLVILHAALFWISFEFQYGRPVLERPVYTMVGLLVAAGVAYLFAVFWLERPAVPNWKWWLWVGGIGLAMRALMLPSMPMLETDFYRYLWDGALTANGHNPFQYVPEDVMQDDAPDDIVTLAAESGDVLNRVNHPRLRTIYPPVAQGAFAAAYAVLPWRIEGLRVVWFVFDAAALALLALLLKRVGAPVSLLVIYWWNPLLIKEAYNSAHMEILLFPFVLGALSLAIRGRPLGSAASLGMAVGTKLWPVLLLPLLAWNLARRQWRTLVLIGGVFGFIVLLMAVPVIRSGLDPTSGFRAYASYWRMNDSIYQVFHAATSWTMPGYPHGPARFISGALLVSWIIWLCRAPAQTPRILCERALWIIAALFLLSPTQFPWYWTWMLPLLAIRPSPGLLILTATLPLYYLRFPMRELGYTAWFDHGVVWLEFGPALVLLMWEAWRTHKETSPKIPDRERGVA
ncbi:MAG: glycosyltransferase 87 family protein [Candidatus Hydrogenedentota bacterium]